ncbi:hypothetical protein BCR44DRAFT_59649 [Catenaria anguillulae PL171]|uniref:Uncharacterized protein n=1 Tax=Catenaria anguillulae PL171 TaxID=765915 RepID=A0A1Y2HJN2_9FUNG|nr:hypothetical protein BCR44DRAFT_59649 [Catenaria anguillulae PL171]
MATPAVFPRRPDMFMSFPFRFGANLLVNTVSLLSVKFDNGLIVFALVNMLTTIADDGGLLYDAGFAVSHRTSSMYSLHIPQHAAAGQITGSPRAPSSGSLPPSSIRHSRLSSQTSISHLAGERKSPRQSRASIPLPTAQSFQDQVLVHVNQQIERAQHSLAARIASLTCSAISMLFPPSAYARHLAYREASMTGWIVLATMILGLIASWLFAVVPILNWKRDRMLVRQAILSANQQQAGQSPPSQPLNTAAGPVAGSACSAGIGPTSQERRASKTMSLTGLSGASSNTISILPRLTSGGRGKAGLVAKPPSSDSLQLGIARTNGQSVSSSNANEQLYQHGVLPLWRVSLDTSLRPPLVLLVVVFNVLIYYGPLL